MDKQIPIYFDSVVIDSPFEGISDQNPNIGRLKVRVFTKYGNRNGSYITEAVAKQLIESATSGNTPVVGFFDPETQSWASHSGPKLANGYGYVEDFIGWEPFQDTDGVTREYAVFSVILFTDYYEEAKKIFGQNQSMELDPESITGDWAEIENQEYYVFKTAKMLGFCVIGEHEPCFSVSSFFSKNDDSYQSQYEKFSSLLFNLKTQVEEINKNIQGGEKTMNEFENKEVIEETPVVEENINEENSTFEASTEENSTIVEENTPAVEENFAAEEDNAVEETTTVEENNNEYELLQQQYAELQTSYEELKTQYEDIQTKITEYENNTNQELENLRSENAQFKIYIENYKAQVAEYQNIEKEKLIEKYSKIMSVEEINEIKEKINDFSYDELESKLAITFANNKIADSETDKVPLSQPVESQFALLMKNYRK